MNTRTILTCAITAILLSSIPSAHAAPEPNKPIKVTAKMIYPDGKPALDAVLTIDIVNNTTHAITTQTYKPDSTGTVTLTIDPAKFANSTPVAFTSSPTGIGFWGGGGPNMVLTSTLEPFTSARVHLVDSTGKPIAHAHVYPASLTTGKAFGMWNPYLPGPWNQTTDAAGYATFTKLPQGYNLSVSVDDNRYASPTQASVIQLAKDATITEATVRVDIARFISGTVLYSTTKKPVAGISVAASQTYNVQAGIITDKNGAYTIPRVIAGTYTLVPVDQKAMFKDWVGQQQTAIVTAGANTTGVVLYLVHGGLITGKVTDPETGKPVSGINVSFSTNRVNYIPGLNSLVKTGPDGVYSKRVSPDTFTVSLFAPGQSMSEVSQQVSVADDETKTVNFQMKTPIPPTVVHGTVLGPDGKPFASAIVTAQQQNAMPQTYTTDNLGHFTIDSPGLNAGSTLMAQGSAASGNLGTTSPFTVSTESQVTLNLVAGALCTLKGQVKDKDGKPIQGASVTLTHVFSYYRIPGDQTQTDANGQYTFPPTLGDTAYTVGAQASGYANTDSTPLSVTASQTVQIPDLVLKLANSFVGGTVVNAAGKPVANVTVSVNDVPNGSTTSDQAGHFMIKDVPEGDLNGNTNTANNDYEFHSLKGGSGDNIITVASPVNGIVLGPDGKPVAGAEVIATAHDRGGETVTTDKSGRFVIDSPGLKPKDTIIARLGDLATPSDFSYSGEDLVTLHLASGTEATIKGQVKSADGAPLTNATVTLLRLEGNSEDEIDHAQCDTNGQYAFPPTYGGSKYIIRAKAAGHGMVYSDQVTASSGQTVQISVITLQLADSFVGGSVVDKKGNPVANVVVHDNDVDNLQTTTDQAGHFMLNGVPRGKTQLWLQSPDNGYGSQDATSGRGDNVIYLNHPGD